ncbi:LytR/AlgR family response regulator transcription factor [Mesoterricola sediminis]|uniref:DNA-binding response regulator n=1 Tax=Mesoterricola sediminis TaxID=2927980 RepID=A0AA48GX90_9BACT|nr:response regulator [Mesoterricola sediminis]BDU77320.1 DNA-binding response regulator [Mesoterricola sediminis]
MAESLRVAVAEDEPFNLKRLVRLLREQGCDVVAQLEDGTSVAEWVQAGGAADALFLDIQMPGLSGLDLLAELGTSVPVVLVTAYAEHALKAFEHAAVDYLLKPVAEERLAVTLQRLRAGRSGGRGPVPGRAFRFPVRAGDGLVMLDLAKTTHLEFRDGAVWAHPGGPWRTLWKTLAEAEQALEGRGLVKGHRHLLLRPEAVVGVRNLDSGRLQVNLAGGAVVEVSRGAAPELKARLGIP